jgi:ketosteroid isomerase-like protein
MADDRTPDSLLAANERFYRAFEALDYPRMEALWEESDRVFCVHPGWAPLKGWRPVLESWARIIENTADIHFTLSGAVAHVAGDVGIVTVLETIHSTVGSERHSSSAVSTNLFGWDAATRHWRIFHHHAAHTVVPDELEAGPLLV